MKIFYNAEPFTAKCSGIPVYAYNLVKNIKELVPDSEIYSGAKTVNPQIFMHFEKRMKEKFGFPIHFSHTFYPTYLQWPAFLTNKFRSKNSEFDIVHILSNVMVSSCFSSWENLIITIHDGYIFHDEMFLKMFLWKKHMLRELPKQTVLARKLITVSEFSKKEIIRYCHIPEDKIHVIPNATQWKDGDPVPIDRGFFESADIAPNHYFLSVGVLRPNKNYPSLLAGYSEYRKSSSFKGEKLVIVGYHEFPEIAEQILNTEGVVSISSVTLSNLKMLYQNAKGFFIVSHMEGFGIPLLEAMQQGCPACYARGTAMDEIGRDAAFSIDSPTDISAISEMFERFSRGGTDVKNSVEKCRKISREYSWEDTARKTLDVYRLVMRGT